MKKLIEELAWALNGTKLGKKCWALYDRLNAKDRRRLL